MLIWIVIMLFALALVAFGLVGAMITIPRFERWLFRLLSKMTGP